MITFILGKVFIGLICISQTTIKNELCKLLSIPDCIEQVVKILTIVSWTISSNFSKQKLDRTSGRTTVQYSDYVTKLRKPRE